jgi:hypothetical protein
MVNASRVLDKVPVDASPTVPNALMARASRVLDKAPVMEDDGVLKLAAVMA